MARSESQGLQIALIIFVCLTIILGLTTIIFFNHSEDADARAATDVKAKAEADKALQGAVLEVAELKTMIGVADTTPIADVRTVRQTDIDTYAPGKNNYKEALVAISEAFKLADAERVALTERNNELDAKYAILEKAKDATLLEHAKQAKANADKVVELTKDTTTQIAAHTETESELKKDLDDAAKKHSDATAKVEKKNKELTTELDQTKAANIRLATENVEIRKETFEVADGEVQWVNQGAGTVMINLGRADSLREQVTFSVWGTDENDVARTESKAKIEVTEIVDDHLAEARIVEDSISDPILKGDKIFTPLWHPGRAERFAITGVIDLDGDGISDRQKVKDLIAMNGGKIDAEVSPEGKIVGPGLDFETRYLIVGEAPVDKDMAKQHSVLQKKAIELGVAIMTLEKFMDHVGWTDTDTAVRFGRNADPKDFFDKTTDTTRRAAPGGATSGTFKKRNPRSAPKSNRDRAY